METRKCKKHGELPIGEFSKQKAYVSSAGNQIYSYRCKQCEADKTKQKRKKTKEIGYWVPGAPKPKNPESRICGYHGEQPISAYTKRLAYTHKGKPVYTYRCKQCEADSRAEKGYYNLKVKNDEDKDLAVARNREYLEKNPHKREQFKRSAKQRRQKNRKVVLTYYGGDPPKCACCGESHLGFLCIDHIDGGGNKERKKLNRASERFWLWLIRNGFPDGYRVLCHNCNFAIGAYGHCCHEDDANMKG